MVEDGFRFMNNKERASFSGLCAVPQRQCFCACQLSKYRLFYAFAVRASFEVSVIVYDVNYTKASSF